MKICSTKKALCLSVIAVLSSHVYAKEFSQTIFFGDSLTDSGRLANTVNSGFIKNITGELQNSFTTNPDPTWAGVLAKHYGHDAIAHKDKLNQTNYAVSSAQVSTPVNLFGFVSVAPVNKQVDGYLKEAKQADKDALYAVWIGANDLLAAAQINNTTDAIKAIKKAATDESDVVNTLHTAGARHILVPNLPDVGKTPRLIQNAEQSVTATTASGIYNRSLYQNLNNSNANVIPANTFALLQEANANPQAFGFTNVTDTACPNQGGESAQAILCKQSDWQSTEPNANETYAFADGIHPSGRTHRILAQYYTSIIDTPAKFARLPRQLFIQGNTTADELNKQLNLLGQTPTNTAQNSLWAKLSVDTAKQNDNKNRPAFTLGLDHANENSHTGIYLNQASKYSTLDKHLTARTNQVGVGLYHRHDIGNIRVNASAGMDRLGIESQRTVAWDGQARTHTGKTTARRTHANLQASYGVDMNRLSVRPYVGANIQKLRIDTLTENEPNLSTALRFHEQSQKLINANVGVDVAYHLTDNAQIIAGIGHERSLSNDDPQVITTSLPSIHEYTKGFQTTIKNDKPNSTTANLGGVIHLGNNTLSASITANRQNQDTDTHLGGFVGLQSQF
ncbi:autotransporter domain-containing protein [Moraxella nasovis]|uniref:autotransporter domain-containing protein n=1 Tax=Moraxella nasovis TaxID=2904121 RepID=UPI001F62450E|nr:autotransporter domain-containing protein [Moraxella nasovis]UNU73710.1 autotransporter domain-containing protein [Moraxella nasovis]